MLPLYIFCAVLGGGLVVLSALGGLSEGLLDGVDQGSDFAAGDIDYAHDLGVAHGPDFDHHVETAKDFAPTSDFWLPFLSLRFWVYFLAGFGLVGTVLSLTGLAAGMAVLWIALGFGAVMGTAVAWIMRALKLGEKDYSIREGDFLGVSGQLTVLPRNGEPGKVRMSIKGETIDMLALADSDHSLERGDEVVVVGMEGTRVRVARLADIMTDEQS